MLKKVWRITDLDVSIKCYEPSPKEKKMKTSDFYKLLKIGGPHLKSLRIYSASDESNWLRVCINAQRYIITGHFYFSDFLKVIADISTNIQIFKCDVDRYREGDTLDILPFSAAISGLIARNRNIKVYQMDINEPHASFLKLTDLPESIEDFKIYFFVEDASTMCDVSRHI